MDDVVYRCGDLSEEDIAFLRKIENDMPIVADVSRGDLLIYCLISPNRAAVVARLGLTLLPRFIRSPSSGGR